MSVKTGIQWTDSTWNPVTGCSKVSPGCAHCYAERMAKRLRGRCGYPTDDPFKVAFHPERLEEPLHWKKPRRIFVCSMGDLFHSEVQDNFIQAVFTTIASAFWHTFIILTKRPERMCSIMLNWVKNGLCLREGYGSTLPNVWLGVTAENQAAADERIPILLETPAAVRFVSCEPMLGPIDLSPYLNGSSKLDWAIVGGESGPEARPLNIDWARSIRDQCQSSGIPFFFKQWGEWIPLAMATREQEFNCSITGFPQSRQQVVRVGKKAAGHLLDGKEWNEWPKQLQ